ncbi:hypothetical protein [Martelella sp. FOR1707]
MGDDENTASGMPMDDASNRYYWAGLQNRTTGGGAVQGGPGAWNTYTPAWSSRVDALDLRVWQDYGDAFFQGLYYSPMAVEGTIKVSSFYIQQPSTNSWPPGTPADQQLPTSFRAGPNGGAFLLRRGNAVRLSNAMNEHLTYEVDIQDSPDDPTEVQILGKVTFAFPMTYKGHTVVRGESELVLSSSASGFAALRGGVIVEDNGVLTLNLDRTKGPLPDQFTIPMDIVNGNVDAGEPNQRAVNILYNDIDNGTLRVFAEDKLLAYDGTLRAFRANITFMNFGTKATIAPYQVRDDANCNFGISGIATIGLATIEGQAGSTHYLGGAQVMPGINSGVGQPIAQGALFFGGSVVISSYSEFIFNLGTSAPNEHSMVAIQETLTTYVSIALTIKGGLPGEQYLVMTAQRFTSPNMVAGAYFTVSGDQENCDYTWESSSQGDREGISVTITPRS